VNGHIKHLHPTMKKCGCGFIGNKTQFYDHLMDERMVYKFEDRLVEFYERHGEVPLNEDEGNEWLNKRWLRGTRKGYND
jgi:hypothetical protein